MKKKAFTLIEMIIVISITGILLSLTIGIGGGRIQELKYQSFKSQFVNFYEKLYSEILTTNYHLKQHYDKFNIFLESNSTSYEYEYSPVKKYIRNIDENMKIENINLVKNSEKIPLDNIKITFEPYKIGCIFNYDKKTITGGTVQFELNILDSSKKYCFQINTDSCKLIEKNINICEGISQK